jgi:hypothetical protein
MVRADISHGAFRLWHLLNDYKNRETGIAFPKQETIAREMRCKIHSLKAWTDELVTIGALQVEKRGQRHHHIYRFPVVLPQWAEREADKAAPMGSSKSFVLPKEAGPRPAPMGILTEPKEVSSISNSRPVFRIDLNRAEPMAYLRDGYIQQKLSGQRRLWDEMQNGRTRLCMEFNEIFLLSEDQARRLAGEAIEKRTPAGWLNRAVTKELRRLSTPNVAGSAPGASHKSYDGPDRNAGTYNAKSTPNEYQSKVR